MAYILNCEIFTVTTVIIQHLHSASQNCRPNKVKANLLHRYFSQTIVEKSPHNIRSYPSVHWDMHGNVTGCIGNFL